MNTIELTGSDREVLAEAFRARERLYLKDVHEVAAALRTRSGNVYTGIHIEGNVGNVGICGEVAAICNAVSHQDRDLEIIVAVCMVGGTLQIFSPCGRCREIITDFNPQCWVILGTEEKPYKVRASELLPLKC